MKGVRKMKTRIILTVIITAVFFLAPNVHADTVTLDFDAAYVSDRPTFVEGNAGGRYVTSAGTPIDAEFIDQQLIFSGTVFKQAQLAQQSSGEEGVKVIVGFQYYDENYLEHYDVIIHLN